jgi:hypothetical protein
LAWLLIPAAMKSGFSAKRRPFHVAFTVASLSVYLLHVLCRTPSARPQERTSLLQESPDDHGEKVSGGGPSPAALQPAPAGVAVKRAVVRLERRSLQELLAEHTPVTGSGGGKRTTSDQ